MFYVNCDYIVNSTIPVETTNGKYCYVHWANINKDSKTWPIVSDLISLQPSPLSYLRNRNKDLIPEDWIAHNGKGQLFFLNSIPISGTTADSVPRKSSLLISGGGKIISIDMEPEKLEELTQPFFKIKLNSLAVNSFKNGIEHIQKGITNIKEQVNMKHGKNKPEKVIFNDPATIVYWKDGTKTVVKAENEPFDKEKGLAMAISKRCFGNKGNYYNVFKEFLKEEV